jgi:glycosyltransferase involved in cell wall biosynthesis
LLSTRSLDTQLYNIDSVLRAFALTRSAVPDARLMVAGDGRLRPQLQALAGELGLGDSVSFTGQLAQDALRNAMEGAHVFVSVPSSDATSVALLQAMAAGSFPIVSDLPSQHELVEDGVQGFRVAARDDAALALAFERGLRDHALRRTAAGRNRAFVTEYGLLEGNLAKMEAWYYRLAGRMADLPPPPVH